jgi:hypothetical protein
MVAVVGPLGLRVHRERNSVNCLAFTGYEGALPLLITAALLAGAGIVVLAIRRGAKGSRARRGTMALAILPLALGALLLTGTPAPAQAATSAASTCDAAGPSGNDPGGANNPGGGSPTPSPSPSSSPSGSPTPTPSPSGTPVCVPNTMPDIDFDFSPLTWSISGNFVTSQAPSTAVAAEMTELDNSPGTNQASDNQYTMTSIADPSETVTGVVPNNEINFTHPDWAMTLIDSNIEGFANAHNLASPYTLSVGMIFGYPDGCGNTLTVHARYTGVWSPPPSIPQ